MTTPAVGGAGFAGPAIRQPVSGLFTVSDFESKSHEELRAMVAQASPQAAADLSRKLADAAKALSEIGDGLKKHTAHVAWEGEGGEAFRTWGSDLANATQRLSAFSGAAGTWMGHAAETLAHVHSSMPEVSAGARTVLDAYRGAHPGQVGSVAPPLSGTGGAGGAGLQGQGPTQQQAYAAQQRLDADRAEAARLMRQLAESYSWSAHNMQGAERPVFPAMPSDFIPNPGGKEDLRQSPEPGAGGTLAQGGSSSPPMTAPVGDAARSFADASAPERHVSLPSTAASAPEQPVASRIDAIAPAAQAPGQSTVAPPSSGTSLSPVPLLPIATPVSASPRPGVSTAQVPRAIDEPRSAGTPAGGVGRVSPGRSVAGAPIDRLPGGAGDGIVGGRATPHPVEQPTRAIPRGTVIGAEPARGQVQTGTSIPHAPGAGPTASGSGRPGTGGGRRLASEPGGVVGGRAQQQRTQAAGRPFTPGGTGLLGERRPDKQSKNNRPAGRPDYLTEDESTWTDGHRRVVPPVID